jgi:Rrf2 family iron-sulfur cluster assembly transcriptional regulator
MRLSTKGRYAVMAMADLARRQDEPCRGVPLADIAERQEISLSYLEQLFARLRRKGLVQSARGPGGGYRLSRTAEATTIADIVLAVDEPLHATRCAVRDVTRGKGCMAKGERCLTHDLWEDLGHRIEDYLASITLADVILGRLGDGRKAA